MLILSLKASVPQVFMTFSSRETCEAEAKSLQEILNKLENPDRVFCQEKTK
jgi:hypothetical protein